MQTSSKIDATNKPTPNFLQAGWDALPDTQQTSVKALKGKQF